MDDPNAPGMGLARGPRRTQAKVRQINSSRWHGDCLLLEFYAHPGFLLENPRTSNCFHVWGGRNANIPGATTPVPKRRGTQGINPLSMVSSIKFYRSGFSPNKLYWIRASPAWWNEGPGMATMFPHFLQEKQAFLGVGVKSPKAHLTKSRAKLNWGHPPFVQVFLSFTISRICFLSFEMFSFIPLCLAPFRHWTLISKWFAFPICKSWWTGRSQTQKYFHQWKTLKWQLSHWAGRVTFLQWVVGAKDSQERRTQRATAFKMSFANRFPCQRTVLEMAKT